MVKCLIFIISVHVTTAQDQREGYFGLCSGLVIELMCDSGSDESSQVIEVSVVKFIYRLLLKFTIRLNSS